MLSSIEEESGWRASKAATRKVLRAMQMQDEGQSVEKRADPWVYLSSASAEERDAGEAEGGA